MWRAALVLAVSAVAPLTDPPPSDPPLSDFALTPAPVGHERRFLDEIAAQLPDRLATERDAFGSLIVRCGPPGSDDGPVRQLIAVGVDEPGYVVSQIRADGYLRVRALGAPTPPGDFHLLREGRPARIWTREGACAGVLIVDSVHLRSPRPEVLGEEHMYLDVGADSPAGVAALGIELLDPVVQHEVVGLLGGPVSAPAAARRAAALVMLRALRDVPEVADSAGLAFAFVAQSAVSAGPLGRGGEAVLRRLRPGEMLVLRGAAGLEEPVRGGSKQVESQGSRWRPLELRVAYADTPVEQVEPDDVEALFRALLQEVVYGEARAADAESAAVPPAEPEPQR
jgi:putative aminopeptidase FrvX